MIGLLRKGKAQRDTQTHRRTPWEDEDKKDLHVSEEQVEASGSEMVFKEEAVQGEMSSRMVGIRCYAAL